MTQPSKRLLPVTREELEREVGHKLTDDDYTLLKAVLDGFSRVLLDGGEMTDALDALQATKDPSLALLVKTVLENFHPDDVPGATPVEKAINFYKMLQKLSGRQNVGEHMKRYIKHAANTEDVAEMVKGVKSVVEGSREVAEREYGPPGVAEPFDGDIKELTRNQILLLQKLSKLKEETMITGATSRSRKMVEGDTDVRIRHIEDFGELPYVLEEELASPTFELDAIRHQVLVESEAGWVEKQKLHIVLIDESGSMTCNDSKMAYVHAVLWELEKGVEKGFARMIVYSYLQTRTQCWVLNSKDDIEPFHKQFGLRSGGMTEIGDVLAEMQRDILDKKLPLDVADYEPEMIIVCDGEDRVNPVHIAVRTTAVVLGTQNPGLKALVESTGGAYHQFYDV